VAVLALALRWRRGREGKLLFGDFFRVPAIPCFRRPEEGSSPRTVVFRSRCFSRCFPSIDHTPSLPAPLIPFPILPSSRDSNSLDRVFAMLPARPTSTTTFPFSLFYYFPSFSGHFRRNTGPLSPVSRPPALSSYVNQNSMRKRGQMYTTRGARRTGCPERSPTAIDFRRLDGISAKICQPRASDVSFLGVPRRQHEYQTFCKTLWSLATQSSVQLFIR